MKTATIRELQHGLNAVLQRVALGEEITITRRGRPVARITAALPAKRARKPVWPDAMARLAERFPGGAPKGKPASELVVEMRGRSL